MIDFHSHILPGLDDGSKDVKESLAMLHMLSKQGVDMVVATPHFYAAEETPDDFVTRRQHAYNSLIPLLTEDCPKIILGAEIAYYEGISRMANLDKLCFGKSNLLLIEMPMRKWTDFMLNEIKNLSCTKGFTVVLAHIERYMGLQSATVWKELEKFDVLMQVNSSFFNRIATRRKALTMLLKGKINVVGSDCHNLKHRPPMMGDIQGYIRHKLGDDFLQDFTEYHKSLLIGNDIG